MEWITILISVFSLIFSIISWEKTHQTDEKLLEIEKDREKDRKCGRLRIFYRQESVQKYSEGKYYFQNDGEVGITITKILLNDNELPHGRGIDILPLPIPLAAGNSIVPYKAFLFQNTPEGFFPPAIISVFWTTSEGKEESITTMVTES